jgi:hypothetical protein
MIKYDLSMRFKDGSTCNFRFIKSKIKKFNKAFQVQCFATLSLYFLFDQTV